MVIYLDGGSLAEMRKYAEKVEGFTTNPSLMKKEGIQDYRSFARAVLAIAGDKPVSFEVLADDLRTMTDQAREIASWGKNVYVKIPVTNTRGETSIPLIDALPHLNLNITAVMTDAQLSALEKSVRPHHIVSVFAGRILDTRVTVPVFVDGYPCRTLWASTREVFHLVLAEKYGYDIITMAPEMIAKLDLKDRDLTEYSLATVRQFFQDGRGISF